MARKRMALDEKIDKAQAEAISAKQKYEKALE